MLERLTSLFNTTGFTPRWSCGDWSEVHGTLHIVSDLAIWAAYLSIPGVLTYFLLRRRDVPFLRVFWLFVAFIVCCGFTHLLDATMFYYPAYRLSGVMKGITAVVSWTTVLALIRVVPRALTLKSNHQFETELALRTEELRASEEAQRRAQERLQQLGKIESLGLLAGGVAHDFNNLLVSILGNADLAACYLETPDTVKRHLSLIRSASERARELCGQMLAYSGRGQFVIRPLDVSAMARELVGLLRVSALKGHHIELDLANDLPAIAADATQLRQVFLNLLTNAAEAMAHSTGALRVRTSRFHHNGPHPASPVVPEELPAGDYVRVEVRDNGHGMNPADVARMFDPFFSTRETGRGLGMAAVLGILRGHQAAIAVETAPGVGTCIRLDFPATTEQVMRIEQTPVPMPADAPQTGKILVIDDDAGVLAVAKRMLEHFGFVVCTAESGADGITTYRKHRSEIRLILLDLTMPGLSGEETFEELRAIDPNVKVLLSSGFSRSDLTARYAGLGFAGFLPKPYRMDEMKTAIREVLG